MNIQKVQWNNSENRISLSFPIAKVNKEKRTVSGFATLDNVDQHGDIVTSEASEKAFQRFRGNLRQMHQPIAIGKVLSFHPEDYYDKASGKTYKGVYVDAYISKGAQDAWEKVLDGTYTGFSIGGNIVTASNEAGDDNKDHRVIKEYDLMELSVVDSPANQLANIFSIQKNSEGSTVVKGLAADTHIDNVYWCTTDQIASSTSEVTKDCVICGSQMENIGWIESAEVEKGLTISKLVEAYFKKDNAPGPDHSATTMDADAGTVNSNQTINLYPDQNKKKVVFNDGMKINKSEDSLSKGGNTMADEKENEVTEPIEKAADCPDCGKAMTLCDCSEVKKAADESDSKEESKEAEKEETVEKSVTNAESEDAFAKMLDDVRNLFGEAINKNSAETSEAIAKSVESVEAARAQYMNAVEGMKKEIEGLTNNIADFFKRIESLEKRLEAYEGETAVKKSIGEVDNSSRENKLRKNAEFSWQGSFLGSANL